ncbi:acyl carrier protein [Streptomyces tsukubensis]|uniref:Phosphopantetheine-binding protein n=1 Tax=Streptomyces tsukubensis TaxID=83656 RepID=A0A1V3ZZX5_9ACTN|nr:acyl carrier protein [Streptomyces tsukubensis]OON71550.1 phosphopantetheine-binding protein [Streptomyces tsukubensis]QFR96706.1 acyl carrier protein [Streptomyces tsukubensis]
MRALEELVADVLGVPVAEVDEETGPATAGQWTSLRHVRIIAAAGREYGLRLTPRQARSCRSVGDLRAVLRTEGISA